MSKSGTFKTETLGVSKISLGITLVLLTALTAGNMEGQEPAVASAPGNGKQYGYTELLQFHSMIGQNGGTIEWGDKGVWWFDCWNIGYADRVSRQTGSRNGGNDGTVIIM